MINLLPLTFTKMVGTRSTRNKPQSTNENTSAELAPSPKRSQRKRRISGVKAVNLLVAENGGVDGATTGLDGAGDKMKLGEIRVLSSKAGIGLIVMNNRHRTS